MSFSNDEDGDGLAALFGGITPQDGGNAEPGRRRADAAADAAPVAPSAAAPAPPAQPPAPSGAPAAPPGPPAPQYPGLAPQQPVPAAPGYPSPASPSYAMPAPAAPAQPFPQPVPPAYQPLAPQPFAPLAPRAYDLPAPAAPPASPYGAPPAAVPAAYPGIAPVSPPTAPYPTGIDPTSDAALRGPAAAASPPAAPVATPPVYQPPAYEPPPTSQPPAYEPPTAAEPALSETPVSEPPTGFGAPPSVERGTAYDLPSPEPIVDPPAPRGFEDLGGQVPPAGAGAPLADATRAYEAPRAEAPAIRSDAAPPATVFPPGPLLPSASVPVDTPEDLERSTVAEKAALALAVLTGPIGLVIAIVTAVRGARRRGWLIGMARASLVLAVISTIAAGIGGYVLWNVRADQIQRAEIAAASAEFCAAGAADPAIVTGPTLGWPAPGATVAESLAAMQAWTDNWTTLAATSPARLRTGMELLATRGQTIIDAVTASRSVDDAANQQQISSIEAQSGVVSWYATYCAQP